MSDTLTTTEHLFAGHALFTAVGDDGERYTYHFYKAKNGKEKGVMVARLLTGPNNTADYSRLGIINTETGEIDLDGKIGTGKAVPVSVALVRWLAKLASQKAPVPNGVVIHHAGACLCCGRDLTVPFPDNPYRNFGLGPICGGK